MKDDLGDSLRAATEYESTRVERVVDEPPLRVMVPGPPSHSPNSPTEPPPARTEFKLHEIPRELLRLVHAKQQMTYHSLAKLGELEERKRLLEEQMARTFQQVVDDRRASEAVESSIVASLVGENAALHSKLLLERGYIIEGLSPETPDDFALNILTGKLAIERATAK